MKGSQWKVAKRDQFGCELWLGKTDSDGYPIVWSGGGPPRRAYVVQNVELHGPMPKGMEVEHRCRRRLCMADAHHTRVTRRVNEQLKRWRSRVKASICDAGHDPFLEGMLTPEGGRVCRRCSRQ